MSCFVFLRFSQIQPFLPVAANVFIRFSVFKVRFGDLTLVDLYNIVVLFRQAKPLDDGHTLMFSDDGTHESMCKAALGERTTTGRLVQEVLEENGGTIPNPGDLSERKHAEAQQNVDKCVVGILEEWEESKKMMKHWFPWMTIAIPSERNDSLPNKGKLYNAF